MIVNYDESSKMLSFEWDSNCPIESRLNHWTEKDFIKVLKKAIAGTGIKKSPELPSFLKNNV